MKQIIGAIGSFVVALVALHIIGIDLLPLDQWFN